MYTPFLEGRFLWRGTPDKHWSPGVTGKCLRGCFHSHVSHSYWSPHYGIYIWYIIIYIYIYMVIIYGNIWFLGSIVDLLIISPQIINKKALHWITLLIYYPYYSYQSYIYIYIILYIYIDLNITHIYSCWSSPIHHCSLSCFMMMSPPWSHHLQHKPQNRTQSKAAIAAVWAAALGCWRMLWKITIFNGKIHYFYGHFQ